MHRLSKSSGGFSKSGFTSLDGFRSSFWTQAARCPLRAACSRLHITVRRCLRSLPVLHANGAADGGKHRAAAAVVRLRLRAAGCYCVSFAPACQLHVPARAVLFAVSVCAALVPLLPLIG